MVDFFKFVLKYEKDNKMSLYNLAVCFAPCLLRSEKPSLADIGHIGKMVNVIKILI